MFNLVDEITYIRGGGFELCTTGHKGNSGRKKGHYNVLRGHKNAITPMILHKIKNQVCFNLYLAEEQELVSTEEGESDK